MLQIYVVVCRSLMKPSLTPNIWSLFVWWLLLCFPVCILSPTDLAASETSSICDLAPSRVDWQSALSSANSKSLKIGAGSLLDLLRCVVKSWYIWPTGSLVHYRKWYESHLAFLMEVLILYLQMWLKMHSRCFKTQGRICTSSLPEEDWNQVSADHIQEWVQLYQ